MSGIPQMQVGWKRCVSGANQALGEALGKVYVEKYFAGDSKQQTLDMVKAIEAAMNKDLTSLSWMSPETKVKAVQKIDLITNKIGYPNQWRDYSKLIIVPSGSHEEDGRLHSGSAVLHRIRPELVHQRAPAFVRMPVQTDPHSPNQIRANGVVRNMQQFATAFSCKKGQPMAPIDRCRVR